MPGCEAIPDSPHTHPTPTFEKVVYPLGYPNWTCVGNSTPMDWGFLIHQILCCHCIAVVAPWPSEVETWDSWGCEKGIVIASSFLVSEHFLDFMVSLSVLFYPFTQAISVECLNKWLKVVCSEWVKGSGLQWINDFRGAACNEWIIQGPWSAGSEWFLRCGQQWMSEGCGWASLIQDFLQALIISLSHFPHFQLGGE
jgi:hypothetical protein